MTFVDICLYLTLIVWLRFVNHILNYYLLTYLLTCHRTVCSVGRTFCNGVCEHEHEH